MSLTEDQMLRLLGVAARPADIDAMIDTIRQASNSPAEMEAVKALRLANGITTVGVATPEVMQVIRLRRRQGYSWQEVAWMVGLSRSHCANMVNGWRRQP